MQNYKISVSKKDKKYTIVLKAETEKIARQKVHDEGYSILSIETIDRKEHIGNTFIFKVLTKSGDEKNGKLVGNDLFKAYVKLKKDLDYEVLELYSEEEKDELDEKKKKAIIYDLKEQYEIVFGNKKEKKVKLEDLDNIPKEKKLDNFYLKKELKETYKLIDFILNKIEKLLSGEFGISLENEKKEKLKNIYNSIVKLKKSTNIIRLKQIGELALIKIGEIELKYLEEKQKEGTRKLLKDTNKLLKQIGSKESFIEKDKDINYIIKTFLDSIKLYFLKFKNKKQKEEIDKHSYSYVKNILFLKRYREKLKENTLFIFKYFYKFPFNKELREDIFIRRKVLKQNIYLLNIKSKGVNYSYTYIKKGLLNFKKILFLFIDNIKDYLFIVILLYILLFLFLININYYLNLYNINEYSHLYNINIKGLFYFIVIFFTYLILYISRNLLLIGLNFAILFFIVIFGVVNF